MQAVLYLGRWYSQQVVSQLKTASSERENGHKCLGNMKEAVMRNIIDHEEHSRAVKSQLDSQNFPNASKILILYFLPHTGSDERIHV